MTIYRRSFNLFSVTLLIIIAFCTINCTQTPPASSTGSAAPKKKISFKPIEGIAYTEVRRQYDDGLGFNQYGYHLEPEWQITFIPKDSVRIFSIVLQKFIMESVKIDHDSVANVAHSWVRVKKMTPDSLLLQVLYVKNMKIDDGKGQIYMTLYSNDYIQNTLHTTVAELQKPPRRDTLFIKKKAEASQANYNKAFAAYQPAVLSPKTPQVKIERKKVVRSDALTDVTLADNYLSPTYTITIHKAYADFDHYMQVIVGADGKLHFVKPLTHMLDEVERRTKVMKGIVDGYLSAYVDVKPGKTLGFPQASIILVRVQGFVE